jgi:hypothetical protein
MSTGHVAILMNVSDNKVLMMTVVDRDTLPLSVPIGLVAVNTTASIYSNMLPQMTLRMDEIQDYTEQLKGMGASGILKSPIWTIKKYNGLMEQLGM